ncbi:uncharacterized protein LOC119831261 [Zerene cesonia]|uniref:uncharacterized protein LOC119831261 n=1 Tax=Zerene cesonia TaxID=33412 RepID=UPI0018E57810|nr:uncharacterized protein LOC119831261 [Zerene cesonia]
MEQIRQICKPKKKYSNVVEACNLIRSLRRVLGVSIFNIESTSGNIIISKFTFVGFVFFALWHSLYFYAIYNVYSYDQTILRVLYDTQLKHYGDLVENVATTTYVIYAMWKISFDLSGATKHMQQLVNIDEAINELGDNIDHAKYSAPSFILPLTHVIMCIIRLLSIWISISKRIDFIPYSKIYQILFSDSLGFATIVHYCVYLFIIRDRYRRINKVLRNLQSRGENCFLVRMKNSDNKTIGTQDRALCEIINKCGKIYSMLYKATEIANDKFGLALLLTLSVWLLLIILYLYYFMEATAAGLFHELDRYIKFLIFVLWQILFAIAVMTSSIYICEITVKEAKITAFLAHAMINSRAIYTSVKEEVLKVG